jgi:hypothetical protein
MTKTIDITDTADRKQLIINNDIDFAQKGWCYKVADILNISYTAAYHWVERNMPNEYKNAYKVDDMLEIRKSIVENCNIDFSKPGWSKELSHLFGVNQGNTFNYVKKYMPEFFENHCYNQQAIIDERKEIVENCNIDFSKKGWGNELAKLFYLSPSATHTWLKRNMHDFYEKYCFKNERRKKNTQ